MPTRDATGGRLGRVNLDEYFRRESAARKIAEKLLTGKPYTRQELVDGTNVSITSVNRVVEDLARAGVNIVRDTQGRKAVFRVVAIDAPEPSWPAINDEVRITGAFVSGDNTMIELESGKSKYRGALGALSKMPPLGKRAVVRSVSVGDDGLGELGVRTSEGSEPIRIEAVQGIS